MERNVRHCLVNFDHCPGVLPSRLSQVADRVPAKSRRWREFSMPLDEEWAQEAGGDGKLLLVAGNSQ
jgi:hypothetical protein